MVYYCASCGDPMPEGESICKGCSSLSANMREEILSSKEKHIHGETGVVCQECGEKIGKQDHYCYSCGKQTKNK